MVSESHVLSKWFPVATNRNGQSKIATWLILGEIIRPREMCYAWIPYKLTWEINWNGYLDRSWSSRGSKEQNNQKEVIYELSDRLMAGPCNLHKIVFGPPNMVLGIPKMLC